ncbi:hypothetical protein [Acidovorax sp.]|uniref:hypothetical protein n=1 Tax=Acidovorax sp. TaxID=1872122 RepID=UPI002ACE6DD2|nr:hypothetical protein [Acidovorax sp.]MDZ7863368.1 hypothetical protein [Acidovorax sp.]
MELPRIGPDRYTLHIQRTGGSFAAYVLRIHQAESDDLLPRLVPRYTLHTRFRDEQEAYRAGTDIARKLATGELSPDSESISEKVGHYRIKASAAFRLDQHKWEPQLLIESRKPENKGSVQDVSATPNALRLNLFPEASTASKYALEYGRRMVQNAISGLKV